MNAYTDETTVVAPGGRRLDSGSVSSMATGGREGRALAVTRYGGAAHRRRSVGSVRRRAVRVDGSAGLRATAMERMRAAQARTAGRLSVRRPAARRELWLLVRVRGVRWGLEWVGIVG